MQTQAAQITPRRKKQSFLHGALILTISMVIVNVIGAIFKIPLNWVIGDDGYGYFSTAYSLYAPIFSLATAGFPIAIAKMVSEDYARQRFRDVRRIHRASIAIFAITGTTGLLIMWLGAPFYLNCFIHDSGSLPAMYILAPAILFSCLSSIYRGYYEGLRNMYPTAISEIIESTCKLVIGLTSAIVIMQIGMQQFYTTGKVFGTVAKSAAYAKSAALPYAVAGAIFGVTVGSVFGYLFLLFSHRKNGDGITKAELASSVPAHTMHYTAVKLIKTAIPIGVGSLAVNIAGLIDATFLQTRIRSILDTHADVLLGMYKGMIPQINIDNNTVSTYLFGSYSTALILFMFIPSITQAFSTSALPNVTSAWTRGARSELKKNIEAVIRMTALICIPSGLGLSILARPIITLVFGADEIASRVLVIMGIGVIFASLSAPIFSMLQAVGRVDLPVKLLAVGLTIKLVLNYTLSGIPEINVLGAGTGTLVCYAFITVFAISFLCKITHIVPNFISVFVKPLLASGICVVAAYATQLTAAKILPGRLATCVAIVIAGIVYAFALLCLKAISRDDVLMLPKGKRIVKMLERHNWIK